MTGPVTGIRSPIPTQPGPRTGGSANSAGFEQALGNAIRTVEGFQRTAGESVEKFLSGESEDLHRAVMATQRAELALELFSQVRNKVVQAYQEIMRMQM
ncbi:MAG: flagellar hook-basal body complex protein FliE [Bryobacterales bacterium]|nr:flagellar hook-basal body complex protein FliE [Bryobacterales bacterium]